MRTASASALVWRRVCAAVATVLLALSAFAQTPSDVLRAFRRLQADTEAGVTYEQYVRGLAEVNAQMRSYADNSDPPEAPGIASLKAALRDFQRARDAWDDQRREDRRYEDGQIAINAYYDNKKRTLTIIKGFWQEAGAQIDHAADSMKRGSSSHRRR